MKKMLFAASLLIAGTTFAGPNYLTLSKAAVVKGGTHIPSSEVPSSILAQFNSQYPTATNVQWQKEAEHGSVVYQAEFTVNGKRMKVQYL